MTTHILRVSRYEAPESVIAELRRIFGENIKIQRFDTFSEALEKMLEKAGKGEGSDNKYVIESNLSLGDIALVYHTGSQDEFTFIRPVGDFHHSNGWMTPVFSHYEKLTGLEVNWERL